MTDARTVVDAQALAEHVRDRMAEADPALRTLGIAITSIAPGRATARMTVRPEMLNGFGSCHGGYLTALADTAFAYACNTDNVATVASGLTIDFVAPAHAGDALVAQAQAVSGSGRTGVYDVLVRTEAGATVAVFRGRSYRLKGRPSVADRT